MVLQEIFNMVHLTLDFAKCRGPALKYGDVNTEATSPGEVKGLIIIMIL